MYDYRKWSEQQRVAALAERRTRNFPRHSPPHLPGSAGYHIITGTCFEHQPFLAQPERMQWFEALLLAHFQEQLLELDAWIVLPNHYHLLVEIPDIKRFTRAQGQLHARTSLEMNRSDNERGRKVWFRCSDRVIRSERHYFTTLNYIHNNPVKHQYVKKWGDWPFSSFHWYLENKGRDWLLEVWREYPVLNYGEGWDS